MSYLSITWSGITWRRVLLAQMLGQAAALLMTLDNGVFDQPWVRSSQNFFSMALYVFFLLPIALAADEAIRRGVRPRYVYLRAMLINPLIACIVSGFTRWFFAVVFAAQNPALRWLFIANGLHISVYGTLGLMVFMNGRTADRMLEGVRGAELRRVQLDRQLVESRLATAEAQIDPNMLFGALAQIKRGFKESAPEAEQMLNDLIQTLRTALTRTAAVNESQDPK